MQLKWRKAHRKVRTLSTFRKCYLKKAADSKAEVARVEIPTNPQKANYLRSLFSVIRFLISMYLKCTVWPNLSVRMFYRISIIVKRANYQVIVIKLKPPTFSRGSMALKRFCSTSVLIVGLDFMPFSNIFKYYKLPSSASTKMNVVENILVFDQQMKMVFSSDC